MQQVIVIETAGGGKRVYDCERRPWSFRHCDRRSTVQRYHGRRLSTLEKIVELDDMKPVGIFGARRPTMHRGDRRLQCERTRLPAKTLFDEGQCFGDLPLIPTAAILLFENDQISGLIAAGSAACVVQQHEG